MDIGPYAFEEFKQRAAEFHSYPAPGLLLGGYMVAKAQAGLPKGTLFEAVVETGKCLPDAVQLLTPCSTGNNRMKIVNLGRYAVSLYDKHSGEGLRAYVDLTRLAAYPELAAWFLKKKPKKAQDSDLLLQEIEQAGDTVCALAPIRIQRRFLEHSHMGDIGVCPRCGEAFPQEDGPLCRGCQGEAPYSLPYAAEKAAMPRLFLTPVTEAVGKVALHDMTQVLPGVSKGAAVSAGQRINAEDISRLQKMGRFEVAVDQGANEDFVHENAGVEAFAGRMAGEHIVFSLPPREGKINFRAAADGLFTLDKARLMAFNMTPDVMVATRQDGLLVEKGSDVAGSRVIPLYISKSRFAEALSILEKPLFSIVPLRRAKAGILVTGTELFQGLIEDKFIPVISAKLEQLRCTVVKSVIAPDDKERIRQAVEDIRAAGADLLITTGGLSVDPGDVTRDALADAGLTDALYGAPTLPGAMSLVGFLPAPGGASVCSSKDPLPPGAMQVLGVPACALSSKITLFDTLLPRLLAGRRMSRADLAALGEGGFCMNCKICSWPKCFFLK
jgi:formylmethanofuran dehydrogenase subunit E